MTKKHHATYVDLNGREWNLGELDRAERRLIAKLQKQAQVCQDSAIEPAQKWCDFDNFWLPLVTAHYTPLGLTRKEIIQTAVFEIAQDLSGRLAVELGLARESDYRDEFREIIRTHFKSRRAFCEATGLSEDMLSHVLAGRKNLALDTLVQAMRNIGYKVRIMPMVLPPSKKSKRPQEVA